jgi:lysine 2,3-aminomutase
MLWQNELHHNITTIEELSKYYHFTEDEKKKLNRLLEQFPMSITRYYLSLINKDDPHDPIARIAVPSLQEFHLEGSFDTSGEKENTKVVGLQHKYAQTALILSTNQCASYCRHCFRRRLVGLSGDEIMKRFDAIENYVAEHKEINNILISGGDSLCQDNHMIKRYLDTFSKMEHLDFIRFGTRIPVVFPQRIINDPELVTMFREYNNIKPIYIVTHFNHPREITKESTLAVKLLRDAGIIVKNQTVLLKGVNDDADTLAQLLQGLTRIGVVPYYIFQCRPVCGVKTQFQIPLALGYDIVEKAKAQQNGQGKCLKYIMSHQSGKIEITGKIDDTHLIMKYHQSKDPSQYGITYIKELPVDETWLKEDHL